VGEVIKLEKYQARAAESARHGMYVEVLPPVVLVKYYRNGVLKEEQRVISESMTRDLLDRLG
jgi:hypothetical protein